MGLFFVFFSQCKTAKLTPRRRNKELVYLSQRLIKKKKVLQRGCSLFTENEEVEK